jgi:hypothetical protein
MTSQKVPFYVVNLMINIDIFENVSALALARAGGGN